MDPNKARKAPSSKAIPKARALRRELSKELRRVTVRRVVRRGDPKTAHRTLRLTDLPTKHRASLPTIHMSHPAVRPRGDPADQSKYR